MAAAADGRVATRSPGISAIDQRDTHRLIPAQFADGGASVLARLTEDKELLAGIFELDNATNDRLLAEVAYHRQLWLRETGWDQEDVADYVDYLADFRAEFHDIRRSRKDADWLSPDSYVASQVLAAQLLALGSAGIIYPSVRRAGGTCIACFRPVLVTNVRKARTYELKFADSNSAPGIGRI